jgi:hypothetical protein
VRSGKSALMQASMAAQAQTDFPNLIKMRVNAE